MELFFTANEFINSGLAEFDSFESKHITRTLRKSVGDDIYFTDGLGTRFKGIIIQTSPVLKVNCQVDMQFTRQKPLLTLGVGFIKQNRMDFMIEKATELGVDEFCFFAGKNSNYFSDNISRWQKITRQAIKQSLRYFLPEIRCFKDLSSLISTLPATSLRLIAHQSAEGNVLEALTKMSPDLNDQVIVMIGPEGGFTGEEIDLAKSADFHPVSFGDFRLRTETAAISAASSINLFRN